MKSARILVLSGALSACAMLCVPSTQAASHVASHVLLHASHHSAADALSAGQAALRSGNYRGAEQQFRAAIAQHKGAAAYAGLGSAAIALHDYPTALDAYKHAVRLAPNNPVYLYNAGYSALYTRDYYLAVNYATSYIKLRPRDVLGYHLRFLAYGGLLKRSQQLKDARMVVQLQPGNASAWNDLGIGLSNTQDFKSAITAFTRAIRLDPKNASYYVNRALAESYNKQPKLALRDFQLALPLAKDPTLKKNIQNSIKTLQNYIRHHK